MLIGPPVRLSHKTSPAILGASAPKVGARVRSTESVAEKQWVVKVYSSQSPLLPQVPLVNPFASAPTPVTN